MKVVCLHTIPTPYRDGFYRTIHERGVIDLAALYSSAGSGERAWNTGERGYPATVLHGFSLTLSKRTSFHYYMNLSVMRALSKARPDVVVLGGYHTLTQQLALAWCLRRRVPFLFWVESHLHKNRSGVVKALKTPFVRAAFRRASGFLACSRYAAEYIEHYGGSRGNLAIVPNTPDVASFIRKSDEERSRREEVRKALGLKASRVAVYVGRLVSIKDVATLVRAAAAVRGRGVDVGLLIVGDGPERGRIELLADDLELDDLVITGFRQVDELPGLYTASDAFVLPSLDEPYGVVVNEAMACALPVILSDRVGAASEVLEDGVNGYGFQAGDIDELAACLERVLSESDRLEAMGAAARKTIGSYSYESLAPVFEGAIGSAAT